MTGPLHRITSYNVCYTKLLRRFKSVDTVAKAKFELAQAVFAKGGNVVVNADAVDAKYIEENAGDNLDKVAIVSANAKKSGYKVKKIKQTRNNFV